MRVWACFHLVFLRTPSLVQVGGKDEVISLERARGGTDCTPISSGPVAVPAALWLHHLLADPQCGALGAAVGVGWALTAPPPVHLR